MSAPSARKIVLGVTGGIAAYKAAELTRLFVKAGWAVQVVMTQASTRFVSAMTFQALSGQAVFSDAWDARLANHMPHIDLSRDAHAILIAPASADFLAKLAHGFADDLLSTLCLARRCPLLVAPAMNVEMWDNPATQRNLKQLAADGVHVLGPDAGDQACGETGFGRLLEPDVLFTLTRRALAPKPLAGKRVLITAGPTEEAIDPVRCLTNTSSGKMGFAVAEACLEAGARVTLVAGPTALATPPDAERIDVRSAAEMFDAVKKHCATSDVFFAVAAVADWRPVTRAQHKLKKSDAHLKLELEPTQDILAWVAKQKARPYCVGFAAESRDIESYAQAKRKKKGIPLIAANDVRDALGADENALILFDDAGRHDIARGAKLEVARALVAHVAGAIVPTRSGKRRA